MWPHTTANTLTLFAATAGGIGVSIVQGVSIDGDAGAYDSVAKTSLERPYVEMRPDEESRERQR
jgi:hypothetical protein